MLSEQDSLAQCQFPGGYHHPHGAPGRLRRHAAAHQGAADGNARAADRHACPTNADACSANGDSCAANGDQGARGCCDSGACDAYHSSGDGDGKRFSI